MINFLKYRWLYFTISAIVIGIGLISIMTGGLRYSVEFIGGTNIGYKFEKDVDTQNVRHVFEQNKVEVVYINKGANELTVKTKPINEKKEVEIKKDLEKSLGKVAVLHSETVGPTLGKELVKKTLIAAMLAILGILLYMTFAFRNLKFALAAIVALIHDLLVVIGVYSIFCRFLGAEVDSLFVTALLTAMSFSVHDTIVIFDKIREYKKEEDLSSTNFAHYVNRAFTETLVRSLNNSMTIIFMLLALTLLGGSTIRFFVATLLVGTITGTYSSPFIATPLLLLLNRKRIK